MILFGGEGGLTKVRTKKTYPLEGTFEHWTYTLLYFSHLIPTYSRDVRIHPFPEMGLGVGSIETIKGSGLLV